MPKGKHKPPSRIKYESSHPTVSCRVSRGLYDKLTEVRENDGKSFADLLKESLGVQQAGSSKSWNKGFAAGKVSALKAVVLGRCSQCGKPKQWDLTNPTELKELNEIINLNPAFIVCKGCGG